MVKPVGMGMSFFPHKPVKGPFHAACKQLVYRVSGQSIHTLIGLLRNAPAPRASLVAQTVKCLSMMQEIQVRPLGWEDPLEKEMATHSSTIAWKIPWTEESGRLQPMWSQRVGQD